MSDLKKGLTSASVPLESNNSSNNNNNDKNHAIDERQLKLQAPAFQRVWRSGLDDANDNDANNEANEIEDDEKVCRICLEEDSPETMIAPCRCKGGSKWVHRECLDEWRTNEKDRAFSKCTECLFEYYLQPVYKENENEETGYCYSGNNETSSSCCSKPQQRRRILFYWMVSRDACLGIVLQQLIVFLLTAVIWACDPNHNLPRLLLGRNNDSSSSSSISQTTMVWLYYGLGWCAFFIALGLYGSVVMCMSGCDFKRAIPTVGPPSEADKEKGPTTTPLRERTNPITRNSYYSDDYDDNNYNRYNQQEHHRSRNPSVSSSTEYYRRARRRQHHRSRYYNNDCYGGPTYYHVYAYPGNDGCCCCCCCCDSDVPRASAGTGTGIGYGGGGGGGGTSRCCCPSSGGSSSDDGKHILLMILLVVAIVLAIIGFFVGVVVIVVAIQRIVRRHVYLLQKRQLVKEFQVMDLQDYDLDQPISTAPVREDEDESHDEEGLGIASSSTTDGTKHPPPSAPVVPMKDFEYLKNLGLMDHR